MAVCSHQNFMTSFYFVYSEGHVAFVTSRSSCKASDLLGLALNFKLLISVFQIKWRLRRLSWLRHSWHFWFSRADQDQRRAVGSRAKAWCPIICSWTHTGQKRPSANSIQPSDPMLNGVDSLVRDIQYLSSWIATGRSLFQLILLFKKTGFSAFCCWLTSVAPFTWNESFAKCAIEIVRWKRI